MCDLSKCNDKKLSAGYRAGHLQHGMSWVHAGRTHNAKPYVHAQFCRHTRKSKALVHLDAVCGPTAQLRCGIDVFLELWGELRQINVQVASQPQHRRRAGEFAFGVQQLCRGEQIATVVTLVSSGILSTKKSSDRPRKARTYLRQRVSQEQTSKPHFGQVPDTKRSAKNFPKASL